MTQSYFKCKAEILSKLNWDLQKSCCSLLEVISSLVVGKVSFKVKLFSKKTLWHLFMNGVQLPQG